MDIIPLNTYFDGAEEMGSTPTERLRQAAEHVRIVRDAADEASLLADLRDATQPVIVSFINAHGANMLWNDDAFFQSLVASDVLLRDGSGMRILFRRLGVDPGLNMNGTDFIPKLLSEMGDAPVALCGTSEPYLSASAGVLGGNVVLQIDGFQDEAAYVDAVRDSGARLVVLAMGMPKQERVAVALRSSLDGGAVIVNGGAILDFLAGRFPRAPKVVRSAGMEWLFRLLREPRRLGRRYVLGNPLFLWRVAKLDTGRHV